jgi:glutaredoxin
MANKIIVFTLNGCFHCNELKKKLIKENIDFTELEIDENKKIWNSVVEQTGYNSLPTVFIGLNGEDEGPIFVPERDYESQEDLVGKIKIYA